MGIMTNVKEFGGSVAAQFESSLKDAHSVTIATGYVSKDTLDNYGQDFNRILSRGGDVTLLVGMAVFQGLPQATYDSLIALNKAIRDVDAKSLGVKVVWQPTGYHGKLYRFAKDVESTYLLGSSNFSSNGLDKNIELVTNIGEDSVKREIDGFLNWILNDERSANITSVSPFPIVESVRSHVPPSLKPSRESVSPPNTPYLDISLARVDQQLGSNLNAFFGRGRLNRSSGVVTPRGWYEVEIIVDVVTASNQLYPKGEFTAHTDDGQIILCSTQGDYYKNLRSRDDLKILGHWIKGKLEQSGVLRPFERVTNQTLSEYGRDYIRLYKISDTDYFMEF